MNQPMKPAYATLAIIGVIVGLLVSIWVGIALVMIATVLQLNAKSDN